MRLPLWLPLLYCSPASALHCIVAGATGKVGRELVRVLRRQGVSHLALTRDVLAAKRLLGVRTPCACVDLDDADGLRAAFSGDERFRLFVACANGPTQAAQEARLFEGAAATGRCDHVVKVSTATGVLEAAAGPAAAHVAAERALRDACGSWTVLRPNVFVETLVGESPLLGLPPGATAHALADAPIAMISTRTVAAVAARKLVAAAPAANETLELSGPAAVTLADVVRDARALGEAALAPQPVDAHLENLPPPVADSMRGFFAALRGGCCAAVARDAEDALGEPPAAAADVYRRELLRRSLDSGDDDKGYNGRGVWTANYRAHLTFDECRRKTKGMGLRTEEEFRDIGVPQYCPSRPDDMFADEWRGWDDFLGVRRPYDDARRLARTLGVASEFGWSAFAHRHAPVLEDLRLPARPSLAYGDAWRGWADWLGLPEEPPRDDAAA